MTRTRHPGKTIEDFSAGYWLVNADVLPYKGERVAVGNPLAEEMLRYTPAPFLKLGEAHYPVAKESSIPSGTIAAPDFVEDDTESPLLAKDESALRLVLDGVQ